MTITLNGIDGGSYVPAVVAPITGENVNAENIQIVGQALANQTKHLDNVVTNGAYTITCLDVMATTLHGNAGTTAGVFGTGATNGAGVRGQGAGTGDGVQGTGGATGDGVTGAGGSTSGDGVYGTGGPVGAGVHGYGGSTSGPGVQGEGGASGQRGGDFLGGTSGDGVRGLGGGTNGVGGRFTGGATAGFGVVCLGGSTNGTAGAFTGFGTGRGLTATSASTSLAIEVGTGNMSLEGASPVKTADPGFDGYVCAANVCKAWGIITIATVTATLVEGYGIASVSVDATHLTINLARAMATADYAPVALTSGAYVPEMLNLGTSQFKISLVNTPTGSANVQATMNAITTTVFVHVYGRQ